MAEAFPGIVDALLPDELRQQAQADRDQLGAYPEDDGWGGG